MTNPAPASLLTEYRRKRDFRRTAEPRGDDQQDDTGPLRFVIQKHAASHLHFDLRLELNGVMKSWAVPKGPSSEPGVRRLAMQVEDHPIEYNSFEGTIPQGEYGGGTVMLWDVGTYSVDGAPDEDAGQVMEERYRKGDVKITFHGRRIRGSYSLVRMKPREPDAKPSWLFIKHRDQHAGRGDIAVEYDTSVVTGRTMDEIKGDEGSDVWRSNREPAAERRKATRRAKTAAVSKTARRAAVRRAPTADRAGATALLQPMLATLGRDVPAGDWTFEPKYDGIRVLAYCTRDETRLITRNGLDKSAQFPEIAEALSKIASSARRPMVLDGEIVALAGKKPARFQELQARMHVQDRAAIARHRQSTPSAIFLFDILLDGDEPLVHEPWTVRRKRLEKRVSQRTSATVLLADTHPRGGEKLLERARREGWEGIIAKRMDARYEPGTRSRAWLKLKTDHQQEFVVGGWTEPRNSRQHLGAILLGYYDDNGDFVYAGHTGGGFSGRSLTEMYRLLKPLERETPPFTTRPKTNERAHWAEPKVVVEVRFNEWTADGKLRQPIFLGIRSDKRARDVRREPESAQGERRRRSGARNRPVRNGAKPRAKPRAKPARSGAVRTRSRKRTADRTAAGKPARRTRTRTRGQRHGPFPSQAAVDALVRSAEAGRVLRQLDELCAGERRGVLDFGRGRKLNVTNLDKVFFRPEGYTKGDLLRFYTIVSSLLLPAVRDRALVLRRFPNGIDGPAFYQQKALDAPDEVRVETVVNDVGERQRRMVGGDLLTLLYTIQLGAVSVDPWHSRVQGLDYADYAVVDLDPGPRAQFRRVVDVALWVREVLEEFGLHAALKTSGATGLHVYIPLPSKTPNEAATLVAQLIATRVAEKHPKEATIVRWVAQRGDTRVYVDYLQNIRGKTLAGPYCVRAKKGATVSTPLEWTELDHTLDPRDYTIVTAPERFAKVGDIWNATMKRRNSLARLLDR